MNRKELKDRILSSQQYLFCLVGQNTSGKSYFLNEFLRCNQSLKILIDDEGTLKFNRKIRKVFIQNNKYFYEREERGSKYKKNESEFVEINENIYQFILFINDLRKKLDTKLKSLGTSKLLNIIDSLLSYNIINIEYFLIDEPEIGLDDRNLKVVVSIIKKLSSIGKKLVLVTHSSRLLELLNVSIGNIYVFIGPYADIKNVSFDDVENAIGVVDKEITKAINDLQGSQESDRIFYDDNILFKKEKLRYALTTRDFYNSLFYKNIFLVEGETEEYLIKNINSKVSGEDNFFVTAGKIKMPFYISLFKLFHDEIYCFFDKDERKNDFLSYLNTYIDSQLQGNCHCFSNDLENELGIDLSKVFLELFNISDIDKNTKRNYKCFYCSYYIRKNEEARKKAVNVFTAFDKNKFDIYK